MSLLQRLFGGPPNPAPPVPSPLLGAAEEGWVDCRFAVRAHAPDATGYSLRGIAQFEGSDVGISVHMSREWEEVELALTYPLRDSGGGVRLVSDGAVSDAFLAILDRLYGTALKPSAMCPQQTFTAISLEGHPYDLSKGTAKIKLFYEPAGAATVDADYGQLYLNVDLEAGWFELNEKDPDYRSPIIRALAAERSG